jgi:carbon monoxide dehydrogenase subunit G
MSTVHVTIEIDAPPQQVWDVVMDPNRLGEWVTIHRSIEDVSDNQLTKGATMEQVLAMRGVSFHVNWTLVEVTAPKAAVWDGKGPAHSRARIRYELSGDGDGPTKFEYTNEFTPPGGRLGSIASRVIVGAASEREANKSLNRLKSLVERT